MPGTSRKLRAKRRNERIKLLASALDRISTVIFAGAVLGPLFQDRPLGAQSALWIVGVIVLHLLGQGLLGLLHEE